MDTSLFIGAPLFPDLIWAGIDDASYDAEHHPAGILRSQKHYHKDALLGFPRLVLVKGSEVHSYDQSTSPDFS
jgi:hypothetical protein